MTMKSQRMQPKTSKIPKTSKTAKPTAKKALPIPKQTQSAFTLKSLGLVFAAFLILVVSVILTQAGTLTGNGHSKPVAISEAQRQLRDQVDTATGSPRSGRDPATQQQDSLAAAASRPTLGGGSSDPSSDFSSGLSTDTSTGASGTEHSGHYQSSTSAPNPDPKTSGISSSGCYYDYGKPGEECLPAHAAENGSLTCSGVRKHFPQGIKVTGTDRFNLDKNHDGIACNDADV